MKICFLILILALAVPGWAYGRDPGLPPHQMFEALISYAEQGEIEKVRKGLRFIEPLLDSIRSRLGADVKKDIQAALATGQSGEVRVALLRAAYCHTRLRLEDIELGSDPHPLAVLRMAYLESFLQRRQEAGRGSQTWKELEDAFKSLYRLLRSGDEPSPPHPDLRKAVAKVKDRLEFLCGFKC